MTVKAMREQARNTYINTLVKVLVDAGEDVGMTGTNEFNFPIVHADGTEDFIVIKVSIPTGSRDGDVYDGYGMRDDYTLKCAEKQAKAQAQAEAKAKKIARDAKRREQLAASKEAHNK